MTYVCVGSIHNSIYNKEIYAEMWNHIVRKYAPTNENPKHDEVDYDYKVGETKWYKSWDACLKSENIPANEANKIEQFFNERACFKIDKYLVFEQEEEVWDEKHCSVPINIFYYKYICAVDASGERYVVYGPI